MTLITPIIINNFLYKVYKIDYNTFTNVLKISQLGL